MPVRGSTVEERRIARATERVKRRVKFYAGRIRQARTGREQLAHACDFAKAVGDELDDRGRRELARLIAGLADERNRL
jgi:hypothetical protein